MTEVLSRAKEEERQERLDRHLDDGWIGVDLDGTLAFYDQWVAIAVIGDPIPKMVERVKRWIAEGRTVKIMTARVSGSWPKECLVTGLKWERQAVGAVIMAWTKKHIGEYLAVTHEKDFKMIELWDDRTIQVIPNTGMTLSEEFEAELNALRGAP
jgi:hypothetical protein